ncbi:MAG: helix-turn-helix transcriptional regulator [Neisseriaceae bacterium]|jgi:hypothetical protein
MHDDIIKEVRKKNLRKIIDEQFKGSTCAFAKYVKRPPGFFYDVFTDKRPLGERIMRSIESDLGLNLYELDRSDDGDFEERKVELINVYSTILSLGKEIPDEESIEYIPISTTLISKNAWSKEQLCFFILKDDSMQPALNNESKVLINTAQQEIINNKIYAIQKGSQIFIKRLYNTFDEKQIIAKSDNHLYPELNIDLTNEANFKIIGMAVLKFEELL